MHGIEWSKGILVECGETHGGAQSAGDEAGRSSHVLACILARPGRNAHLFSRRVVAWFGAHGLSGPVRTAAEGLERFVLGMLSETDRAGFAPASLHDPVSPRHPVDAARAGPARLPDRARRLPCGRAGILG